MNVHEYETRADAAIAAGKRMINALHRRLEIDASAAIIVSGGTTPGPVYSYMAHKQLDWHRVHVLLSDERWVPADHPESNEKMLRDALARSRASYAQIARYFDAAGSLDDRCVRLEKEFADLPLPFTSALLGMGSDGHFASLFPDAANLQASLDLESPRNFVAVDTASSPHRRLSMTLPALLRSDEILLLISGADKRAVLEQAATPDSDLPIAHLLRQSRTPVDVFWAP
ncbi:MAG: 6-phosphogluconolactonase [Chromatiales bacterium]|nr:MAG: 6-phosphogluconolactonase [Chromatiales bacterium]